MEPQIWLFVAGPAAIVAILYAAREFRKRRLLPLAEVLDERGGEVRGLFTSRLEGHFQGRPATLGLIPGGKNSPPEFRIGLACASAASFAIRKERAAMKVAKALRLMRDLEVGDPDLDGALVFSSSDPQPFAAWARLPDVKATLRLAMEPERAEELAAAGRRLQLRYRRYSGANLDPASVLGALQAMSALARSLETDLGG